MQFIQMLRQVLEGAEVTAVDAPTAQQLLWQLLWIVALQVVSISWDDTGHR
jgi:NAD-dependent oxidoreductase involved in siderophore biosynthesis